MNNPELYASLNDQTGPIINGFALEYSEELGRISGRCLDIGSGPADALVEIVLPKLNPEATLVCSDISESMVEFAKKKHGNNPRLSFMKLDIETPDLPKDLVGQFVHVTSFYCFHFCSDLRKTFQNIFDLLQPGGTTLCLFIGKYSLFDVYKKLAAMPRYQPHIKDVDHYVPITQHAEHPCEALKALLKEVGFEVHHCSLRETSYIYNSPEMLHDFYVSVNPFIDRIPDDLREEYANDLAKEMTKNLIVFKKNKNNEEEYSILTRKHVFFIYLKKPLAQ